MQYFCSERFMYVLQVRKFYFYTITILSAAGSSFEFSHREIVQG